jgi:hypothetical protein
MPHPSGRKGQALRGALRALTATSSQHFFEIVGSGGMSLLSLQRNEGLHNWELMFEVQNNRADNGRNKANCCKLRSWFQAVVTHMVVALHRHPCNFTSEINLLDALN